MINYNYSDEEQQTHAMVEEKTPFSSEERAPNPNLNTCPCPNYSSIVNMTNNDGSLIYKLHVVEGTGNVWQGDYVIDNSWTQLGGTPSGAIWEDIKNPHQEYEANGGPHSGSHVTGLSGADLWTEAKESYDFFISDENGTLDRWGQYLTIETYHGAQTASNAVGNNIDTAYLLFADGTKIYASSVVLYELGTYNDAGNSIVAPNNGFVENVLGPEDGTFTYLGNGWTKMVLCFGEYEDGSCQNATDPNFDPEPSDPIDPTDPIDPGNLTIACPCPTYDSIVNITSGINNAPIDKFWAIEGTGGTYTYEASINTGWVGSGFAPTGDLWEDIPNQDQRTESCVQSPGWSELFTNADLKTQSKEAYDFYISDATGNLDPFGQYITIEVSHCKTTSLSAVGGNIDSAWIQLMDGTTIYPSQVVYYETGDNLPQGQPSGTSTSANGYVYNVLHSPDGEFTYMGNNWSKMVLCFAEYEGGVCANFGEGGATEESNWPKTCECPMYETLMGMENTDGATVQSIGIREYTGTPNDIIYSKTSTGIHDFYGPAVINALNQHGTGQASSHPPFIPWDAEPNLFIDTDNSAEAAMAQRATSTANAGMHHYTIYSSTGIPVAGPNGAQTFPGPNLQYFVGGGTWIYDYTTRSNEAYDFYVSDELGNLDSDGQYLTIEVQHATQTGLFSVGGNIDSVWVELNDGSKVYAKKVVYFEPGTYLSGGVAQTVTGDGSAALGAPDGAVTFMGNGYSKMVVCFGSNETGEDVVLKNAIIDEGDCKDCGDDYDLESENTRLESEKTSVLSGDVGKENMIDLIIGCSVGALGAIILLKKKPSEFD